MTLLMLVGLITGLLIFYICERFNTSLGYIILILGIFGYIGTDLAVDDILLRLPIWKRIALYTLAGFPVVAFHYGIKYKALKEYCESMGYKLDKKAIKGIEERGK